MNNIYKVENTFNEEIFSFEVKLRKQDKSSIKVLTDFYVFFKAGRFGFPLSVFCSNHMDLKGLGV